jgi:sugar lactone lactonase YvrE
MLRPFKLLTTSEINGRKELAVLLSFFLIFSAGPAQAWLSTTMFWKQNILRLLAGNAVGPGNSNGTGTSAKFYYPDGVAVDSSGNVYVADTSNNLIRKITPAGVVTTLAGSGSQGSTDGTGVAASFNIPTGVAVDSSGNVYVADSGNNLIRKITPAGVVNTFAGSGTQGSTDGTGVAASFNNPFGVAVDSSGNVYVADEYNNLVRKITSGGVVTTFASGFFYPTGVAVDASGNIYVADSVNQIVWEFNSSGSVITSSSSGFSSSPIGVAVDSSGNVYVTEGQANIIQKGTLGSSFTTFAGSGSPGLANGTGTAASFNSPAGIAVDSSGNVYVADGTNNEIRKITSSGVVTTLAGAGPLVTGATNGTGTAASFSNPWGMTVDSSGNVYVADSYNSLIRKITSTGVVTTLAGGAWTFTDGTGTAAGFAIPTAVAVDSSGNVYAADTFSNSIRKITSGGVVTTLAGGGSGTWFYGNAPGSINGTGSAASFNSPEGLAIDSSGNIYVADEGNNMIRKITSGGVVTTFAGSGSQGSANGTGTAASFYSPFAIAVDGSDNIYVADTYNNLIRKITPGGVVTTLAGSGSQGSADGTGAAASFNRPFGITADSAGYVYVADTHNNLIRKITPSGVVSTVIGQFTSNFNTVGLPLANSTLQTPMGITVRGALLYISVPNAVLLTVKP